MTRSIIQEFIETGSSYIPVKKDGRDVIRVSDHLPNPYRLRSGGDTKYCKNIYLIFVKNMIDVKRASCAELARFIRWRESCDADEQVQGDVGLNNLLFWIGDVAGKGVNYRIINNIDEVNAAVEEIKKMLKTTVFVPLEYIAIGDDL